VDVIGRKKGSSALTNLELQLMQVLWQEGSSSVQEVQKSLAASNDLAYTTVQTVLNTLERKGKVRRSMVGRAFAYEAAISKETILKQAVRELAERMFGGSSEDLVMSLVKSRQVDAGRIADLSRKIAAEEESSDE
jgi:predicted transcriptional regulator